MIDHRDLHISLNFFMWEHNIKKLTYSMRVRKNANNRNQLTQKIYE